MNYIKRLETEVANRDRAIEAARADIDAFVAQLYTAKFIGTDTDGSRKDWISTGDVLKWLQDIRGSLAVEVV